jgi:hypothetical protein
MADLIQSEDQIMTFLEEGIQLHNCNIETLPEFTISMICTADFRLETVTLTH